MLLIHNIKSPHYIGVYKTTGQKIDDREQLKCVYSNIGRVGQIYTQNNDRFPWYPEIIDGTTKINTNKEVIQELVYAIKYIDGITEAIEKVRKSLI